MSATRKIQLGAINASAQWNDCTTVLPCIYTVPDRLKTTDYGFQWDKLWIDFFPVSGSCEYSIQMIGINFGYICELNLIKSRIL